MIDTGDNQSIDSYLKIFVEFSKETTDTYFEKESQIATKHNLNNKNKLLESLNDKDMMTIHYALMYSIHTGMIKISKAIIKKYTKKEEPLLNINFNRCEAF